MRPARTALRMARAAAWRTSSSRRQRLTSTQLLCVPAAPLQPLSTTNCMLHPNKPAGSSPTPSGAAPLHRCPPRSHDLMSGHQVYAVPPPPDQEAGPSPVQVHDLEVSGVRLAVKSLANNTLGYGTPQQDSVRGRVLGRAGAVRGVGGRGPPGRGGGCPHRKGALLLGQRRAVLGGPRYGGLQQCHCAHKEGLAGSMLCVRRICGAATFGPRLLCKHGRHPRVHDATGPRMTARAGQSLGGQGRLPPHAART